MISLISGCHQDEQQTGNQEGKRAVKVKVAPVEVSHQHEILKYSGTIEASQTIPLTFQTTGIVDRVFVEEGDFVKQGQLLAHVEKGSLESAYQGALAKYEQALDAQTRLRKVYEKGSLPEIKWVEVNSQVAQAKSMLELTETNLQNCEMRAPTHGVVGERNIEPGMSAVQLEAPLKLVKLQKILVKISVPENEISKFNSGQKAGIMVSALDNKQYQGIIERIGVVANRLSRTYSVKIAVDNAGLMLKPGMVCEVEIPLTSSDTVLLVPITSVDCDANGQTFVFKVDQNQKTATKNPVQIEGFENDMLVIASGLREGEVVVVQGNQKITDQTNIEF